MPKNKGYYAALVLTVDEVAEWLKTSPEVVLAIIDEGRLNAVRLVEGERPVVRPEDVIAFVEQASGSDRRTGDIFGASSFPPVEMPPMPMWAPRAHGHGPEGAPAPPTPPTPPVPPVPPVATPR